MSYGADLAHAPCSKSDAESLEITVAKSAELTPLLLGATLYTPATHPRLTAIVSGETLHEVRSIVICTEDAVRERDVPRALNAIVSALSETQNTRSNCFVRPRSPRILAHLLSLLERAGLSASRLTGVVLPKVDERILSHYAEVLARAPHLWVMPTIESPVAFYRTRLETLRDQLSDLVNPVLCVRIGGNDLLQLLGIKRPPRFTIYDTPLRSTLNDLIVTFRPAGYELSAPVFDYLDDHETLRREVEMDLAYGLQTKTAIHPDQARLIESIYAVDPQEFKLARALLAQQAPAVFQMGGQMCEPSTHHVWATRVTHRAALFGVSG